MAKVPGSCGELAQGVMDGGDLLITCPISWHSEVDIDFSAPAADEAENFKSYAAARAFLSRHGSDRPFSLTIRSELPRGKGMASSSSDIAAACAAAARALDLPVSPDEIKAIALSIEPTDGVFFPGIVAFDHIHGERLVHLGAPPAIKLAIFDFGGEIDTIAFNKRADLRALRLEKQEEFAESYALVREGLATGNPVLVGKGATISALANQKILRKPGLEKMILIGNGCGALGVNAAHSGAVAGILFDGGASAGELGKCVRDVLAACPGLIYLGSADLVGGGIF
jgi:L-threonine kinase